MFELVLLRFVFFEMSKLRITIESKEESKWIL